MSRRQEGPYLPMTDTNGTRYSTVHELATQWDRTTRTVRRLVRPYRDQCLLRRQGKHPRLLLFIPDKVADRILDRILREPVKRNL